MARRLVRALGIEGSDIDWQAVGPPPERSGRLLADTNDVSLIRVEEAIALTTDDSNSLHTLLGFAELKELVPLQPHGVLAMKEAYEQSQGEEVTHLARGVIRSSRAPHDDFKNFRKVHDHHVSISAPDPAIRTIWKQEPHTNGFAVNGELTHNHWQNQMTLFYKPNPGLPRITRAHIIAGPFVSKALESHGIRDGPDTPDLCVGVAKDSAFD